MTTPLTAQLRYLKISPRKTRFVADTIRGLSVNEAESQLLLSPRRPAHALLKLLRSAAANAHNNFKIEPEKLFVKEIRVDQGPKTGRWTPRARGSASLIERKTSHVTIILGAAAAMKPNRYTILPKPKKESTEDKKKRWAAEAKSKHEGDESKHKAPAPKDSQPKTPGGFMKRVFRRKSI